MIEEKLKQCLFSLWNNTISRQEAEEEIRRLLSRKTPRRLFRDLWRRKKAGGDGTLPMDTFITTCALFCRGQNSEEAVLSALCETHMEKMLLTGYRIFLLNKNKKYSFSIKWTDNCFANKHQWFSRFGGMFHDMGHYELISIERMLYRLCPDDIWQLAKEDPNDLLLLNWFDTFLAIPPVEKALQLLRPDQSPRRHALAFWWITFPIQQLRGTDEQANAILSALAEVPDFILVPRIYEFLLVEQNVPQPFRAYLLDRSRDVLLREEFKSQKLCNFYEAAAVASLIKEMRPKQRQKFFWKTLLFTIEEKVKNGDFNYSAQNSREFLSLLPEWGLTRLQENLRILCEIGLHTKMIDYMVRPQLHQHDIVIDATIQKMLDFSVGGE